MPLEWIICSREERLPEAGLLVDALTPTGTAVSRPEPSAEGQSVRLGLAFEKCEGSLEFRLTPEGVSPFSRELSPEIRNGMTSTRLAAKLSIFMPRGRERHGVLWGIRIAGLLSDHLEGPVLDVLAERGWRVDQLKTLLVGRAFDPKNHMRIDVRKDEHGRVWLSTFGLGALGQPELLVPGVRPEDETVAASLLLFVADQEIGRAELKAGDSRGLQHGAISFVAPSDFAGSGSSPFGERAAGLVIVPAGAPAASPGDVDTLMAALAKEAVS